MQIENSSSVTEKDVKFELWDFDGASDQRWTIDYVGDGYYKIISAGGYAVTASSLDTDMKQTTYTGSDTQQWKITKTSNGMYKFSPKSNTSAYMATDDGAFTSYGRDIQLRQNQSDYSDEWEIITNFDSTFVAIPEGDSHPHDATFSDVEKYIHDMGYQTNRTFTFVDESSCIAYIATSKIFYSRSHGSKTSIQLNDDELTISALNNLGSNALSNCKLVVYGACLTASGGNGANNLMSKTQEKGAVTVIGFKESVYCIEVNIWAKAFFEALADGETVESACNKADQVVESQWTIDITTDSWEIAGSRTATFN